MKNLATDLVWQSYKSNGKPELRQELTLRYFGLVKYVVRKMIKNFPPAIEEQDLYHIGTIGLIEAIDRFDLDYGIKFETYAIPRIKGSIIDELRKLDWIPRSLRNKTNQYKEKTVELEQKFGGSYTDEEVSNGLGIGEDDLNNWKRDMNSLNMLSLDRPIDETNGQNLYDMIEEDEKTDAINNLEEEEMREVLLESIQQLPEKTRLAITLYYYEKLTFKEIGNILNVSESRISQIHSETMTKLKKSIRKMVYA